MGKSDLLRVQDVRDAYRLIGECRDLGTDPGLWQPRMFEGVSRLVGAPTVTGGEGRWLRPQRAPEPVSAFVMGMDARGQEGLSASIRDGALAIDPVLRAIQQMPARLVTVTRTEVVSDTMWYRSVSYNEYRRWAGDHCITSVYQRADAGAISCICLIRPIKVRDFSPRERRLLNFFHGEIGPLIGRSLVSATEPSPEKLSPRLRQTLACLLEGDSEKQVAARLGLSQATTHQYVTALYRRFGVQSRAQLLAHALKRAGIGRWRPIVPGTARPART